MKSAGASKSRKSVRINDAPDIEPEKNEDGAKEAKEAKEANPDILSQALTWTTSLFGGGKSGAVVQQTSKAAVLKAKQETSNLGGDDDDETLKPAPTLTFTCTHEESITTIDIKVCGDQNFENFLDLIQNEFGKFLWPVLDNPGTGEQTLISDDDKFTTVCEEAEVAGGRLKLLVMDAPPLFWDED